MDHPPINQLITFLYTRDLDATAHFYEHIMGLSLVADQGDCRIYQASCDGYLGFCRRVEAPAHPGGIILTLVTDAVDEWYYHLLERGVSFDSPPHLNPNYRIYHCFLRDPNGYLLEIQRFLDPEWSRGARVYRVSDSQDEG